MAVEVKYTTQATAIGGREGFARPNDGPLESTINNRHVGLSVACLDLLPQSLRLLKLTFYAYCR
jgi:hypothetical protein